MMEMAGIPTWSQTVTTTKPDWGIVTTWQVFAIATSGYSPHASSSTPLLLTGSLAFSRIDGGFRHLLRLRSTMSPQCLVRISMAAPRPRHAAILLSLESCWAWRSLVLEPEEPGLGTNVAGTHLTSNSESSQHVSKAVIHGFPN